MAKGFERGTDVRVIDSSDNHYKDVGMIIAIEGLFGKKHYRVAFKNGEIKSYKDSQITGG